MATTALSILQQQLKRKKIGAFLVSQPENRRFLSGYSAHDTSINESSGYLLITPKGQPLLLTDSRFKLQAEQECPAFEVVLYKKGLLALLKKLASALKIETLAFESDYFLFSKAQLLQSMAKKQGFAVLPSSGLIEKMRRQKSKKELLLLEQSVSLNEKVFGKVYKKLSPGISEIELALKIEATMRRMGAEGPSFPTIVASGPNSALPHATPSDRIIKENEPIVIDMGLVLEGVCSDMTRTVVLGTPDKFTKKIFKIVRKAQVKAAACLKPGVLCRDVDKTARDIIKNSGYGPNFGHSLGHGVGYAVHEAPSLSPRSQTKLREGMVITIEPGIYIPGWGGVRLENMAYITKNGYHLMNKDKTFLDIDKP